MRPPRGGCAAPLINPAIPPHAMANQKCVSCGIGFFSPTGAEKCSRCAGKEEHGHEHHGCGCSH